MFRDLPVTRTFTYQEILDICYQHDLETVPIWLENGPLAGSKLNYNLKDFTDGMASHDKGGWNGNFYFELDSQTNCVYFCDPLKLEIKNGCVSLKFGAKVNKESKIA